jgi:hypothetical protein
MLIPAKRLVNGTSVAYYEGFDVIEYFHLELPSHSVIYAEGAPAETWLDCGNRNMFGNAIDYLELAHPEEDCQQTLCLPLVTDGPALDAIRRRLAIGFELTFDSELALVVDGVSVDGVWSEQNVCCFELPAAPKHIVIRSRTFVPAEMTPDSTDQRVLGVSITKVVLRSDHQSTEIEHANALLSDGFHESEAAHRWTSGNASIPEKLIKTLADAVTAEVHLSHRAQYPRPTDASGGRAHSSVDEVVAALD